MKKIFIFLFLTVISIFICDAVNAETVTVKVPTVVVNAPSGTGSYYVTLEAVENENPMPTSSKKQQLVVNANSEGEFGNITFSEPGYYHYKIYQTNKTLKNIKYDSNEYEYLVQIYREEGGILRDSVALTRKDDSNKLSVVSFSNLAKSSDSDKSKSTKGNGTRRRGVNPYTADVIVKYFVIAVISIILILILIIYVRNSRNDK